MRRYYPNISPPWEEPDYDVDSYIDAAESDLEDRAVEEYYEEYYGKK